MFITKREGLELPVGIYGEDELNQRHYVHPCCPRALRWTFQRTLWRILKLVKIYFLYSICPKGVISRMAKGIKLKLTGNIEGGYLAFLISSLWKRHIFPSTPCIYLCLNEKHGTAIVLNIDSNLTIIMQQVCLTQSTPTPPFAA